MVRCSGLRLYLAYSSVASFFCPLGFHIIALRVDVIHTTPGHRLPTLYVFFSYFDLTIGGSDSSVEKPMRLCFFYNVAEMFLWPSCIPYSLHALCIRTGWPLMIKRSEGRTDRKQVYGKASLLDYLWFWSLAMTIDECIHNQSTSDFLFEIIYKHNNLDNNV